MLENAGSNKVSCKYRYIDQVDIIRIGKCRKGEH